MKSILKDWWRGTYVPRTNDPYSQIIVVQSYYARHWTSKVAHAVSDFWLKYWQWCMGFGLAVIGLIWKH